MDMEDKIMKNFLTNVAVNTLLQICIKMWGRSNQKDHAAFVRIFLESQIHDQWTTGKYKILEDPNHIDQLRWRSAEKNGSDWGSYVSGRNELRDKDHIDDEERCKAYSKQAKRLSRKVLKKRSGRFLNCCIVSDSGAVRVGSSQWRPKVALSSYHDRQ